MSRELSEQELFEMAEQYLAPNYAPFHVMIKRAEGCWVWDVEGRRYLDMLSCYSALNFGHLHPRIIGALREQLAKVTLTSRAFLSDELVLFSRELAEFCGMEMILPMNTGAEAVETALKYARKWGYVQKGISQDPAEAEIIVCANNFHGRTITIISFSTEPQYKDQFGPHTPGFRTIPFGDAQALYDAITDNTVAFLFEPIQGEGGIVVPWEGYLRECAEICKASNVLLIADEIQTGLARTGRMLACDYEDVIPDIWILGKALGGGVLPLSAVVGSRDLLRTLEPGDHGSTFGGNPLACAVGRESLRVLVEENLAERAAELGAYMQRALKEMKSPHVKEVRGKGLLIGVELHRDGPNAHEFCERLIKQGILCKDTKEFVMRFAPPLTITREEIDWALERIEAVVTK